MNEQNLYAAALAHYGELSQYDKLIEEMAELTQAILKLRRDPGDRARIVHLHEEFMDVCIVMEQIQTSLDMVLLTRIKSDALLHLHALVTTPLTVKNIYNR